MAGPHRGFRTKNTSNPETRMRLITSNRILLMKKYLEILARPRRTRDRVMAIKLIGDLRVIHQAHVESGIWHSNIEEAFLHCLRETPPKSPEEAIRILKRMEELSLN